MPYVQPWVDPNTGATYPQSFLIAGAPSVDFLGQKAEFMTSRYVSEAAYSLGYGPVDAFDTVLTGAAYASWFSLGVGSAQTGYAGALISASDVYVGANVVLSGAIPVKIGGIVADGSLSLG